MIKLHTFGSVVLVGEDGAPLLGPASQRRTLGLVCVLAVAGDAGLSRDKLVGIFWPEVEPRRARHSLTQALYAARQSVDRDELFLVSEDVRLNPACIASDVAEFEVRLEAGDDAAAAALYRGPFLDGLFLGSLEFERWAEAQRGRLEGRAVSALERLAALAAEEADWKAAAEWLRRLVEIRPADPSVTQRLMEVLGVTGDRAGAIQVAQQHARILRDDFELEPDPTVMALAEDLRVPRARPEPPSAPDEAVVEEVEAELMTAHRVEAVSGVPRSRVPVHIVARAARPAGLAGAGRSRVRRAALALGLIGVTALALVARRDAGETALAPLDHAVVVAPFRVSGADGSLEYLREGMVELLSNRLADEASARPVDAGAVMRAWRQAGVTGAVDVPRERLRRLAGLLGAERVIVGSVVGTPRRTILSASMISVASGEVSGEATVEGPADSLTTLLDRLAGGLLVSEADPEERLADRTTGSLRALRAFLAGAPAYARGDFGLAADHYTRALAADSTFGLAALRLAWAAARLHDFELQRRALHQAWRFREGLSARDRAHLTALVGPRYPAPFSASESLAAWEAAVSPSPRAVDAWHGFAIRLGEDVSLLETEDGRERAVAALQHALELDPNHATSILLLGRLDANAGAATASALGPFLRWRSAAVAEDSAVLGQLADSLEHLGPANLRALAAASQFDGLRLEDGARAIEILLGRAAGWQQAFDLLLARHSIALNQGRPAAALEVTRRLPRLSPATRAHLRLRVLDALYGPGDSASAAGAAGEIERVNRVARSPNRAADACVLAQWWLARGDTAAVRLALEELRGAGEFEPAPASMPPAICVSLVEASLAAATGGPDARGLVQGLDSLVLTTAGSGDAAAYAHLAVSRLHRSLGDPERALAAIRRRPYMAAVWPRYLATALREEGELAAAAGDLPGALAAYRRFLSLRTAPEEGVAAEVAAVRQRVETLREQLERRGVAVLKTP